MEREGGGVTLGKSRHWQAKNVLAAGRLRTLLGKAHKGNENRRAEWACNIQNTHNPHKVSFFGET